MIDNARSPLPETDPMMSQRLAPDEMLALDRAHLWHPYAPATGAFPLFPVASAAGATIALADGRMLIDGMSSWWSAIHGYNHPRLNAAAAEQLEQMSHVMFGGLTHEPAVRLAKLLVDITPTGLNRVFFADSGSVAVEVAIKMALQYWQALGHPEKHRLLALRSGYHGDTFGAMAVCDPVTGMHHLFAHVLPSHLFAPAPTTPFGATCTEEDLAPLRELLERHGRELAALILEPVVQGAGGMRIYSADFVRQAKALCTEHRVLLIADEIATGFGRTGALFACDHAGISPDIMCVGKALTGGYLTLAATLCQDHVADAISRGEPGAFMHGPTFMANPLACRIALESTSLLLAQDWQGNIQRIERGLRQGLAPAAELPGVREVRVIGGIGVVEMEQPVQMADIQPRLVEHGIWVRPFGRLVYVMPPYVISDEELAFLCRQLCTVIAKTR